MKKRGKRIRKSVKIFLLITSISFIGFIAFILNETKDEVNANMSNIESKLSSYFNENKMAGFAVSVFNADSIIYTTGIGYQDVKKKIPYNKQTQQYIASISKTTIGIALLKAEELGFLNIEDPINKYLSFHIVNPNFPNKEITISQLATHTSSLDYNENVVESLYIDDNYKEKSLEEFMVDYFKGDKYGTVKFTNNPPGSNWNYSNIGASLVAYIIEVTSKMSFSDFTKKHIFEPLDLNNTFWFRSEADSTKFTKYYEAREDAIINVNTSGVKLYPSRDLITNIEDLTTYCQAIISKNPKLLQSTSFDKLLSPRIKNSVSDLSVDNSGFFFMIDRNQYGITYQLTGMNGGDNCINTMMWFDPKTELGYIFIGNTGGSKLNKYNHIYIYRSLVSLGDHILMENGTFGEKIEYKWHNLYNRVRALF
ncbi:MAG: beta-lactamase family protein [Flavobacteriaceae bacterium]|nr:beta-lactamase family protein [Flavobacteriaceae bacterium]